MGFPIGSIIMWYKEINLRPAGWELCDGTNGTPDLRDKFIKGASVDSDRGVVPSSSATHVHTNSVAQNAGDHIHDVTGTLSGAVAQISVGTTGGGGSQGAPPNHSHSITEAGFDIPASGNHTHTTSDVVAASSLPPFVQVYFIMKVV